jgi:heme oxygenase
MLYPLEGSTLGGQVIARQIRSLGAGRFPLRFFEAYGGYVLPRWNEFLAWSEASCPAEDHARAIKAAVAMFGVIRAHFDECYGRTNPVSGEIYSDSV